MMHMTPELLERMAQKRRHMLAKRLSSDLEDLYPKRMRTLGEKQRFTFAQLCTEESHGLGCTTYGELKSFAFVALQLGTGFATDPLYSEIVHIFNTEDIFALKMEKIIHYAFKHTFYVHDEASLKAYQTALHNLLRVDLKKIKQMTSYQEIVQVLEEIYPQRVKALGGKDVLKERLKHACYKKTIRYNIDHPIGIFVYTGLVFFLGHKVDSDPLYAWVEKYLNSTESRMAYKLDKLVRVIRKRIKNNIRYIEKELKEYEV